MNKDFLQKNEEVALLRVTNPHAIITTNYDNFLEAVFPDYFPVVGQKIIKYNFNSIGEIIKIHGSVDDSPSIVLTGEDYDGFVDRKKYLSAKLLTYLAEHPVFVFGYAFNDPNVTEIIQDIGDILGDENKFIDNIFFVRWDANARNLTNFQEDYVIGTDRKQFRVRAIVTDSFDWIYKAISQERGLNNVNMKILRALSGKMYKMIRSDIPRRMVEVNYDTIEGLANSTEDLPKLLGITGADTVNKTHPFTLSQVGKKLGFNSWHRASKLISKINDDTGVNIRDNDNNYHCKVKTGMKAGSHSRKFSNECVELLKAVRDGNKYELKI